LIGALHAEQRSERLGTRLAILIWHSVSKYDIEHNNIIVNTVLSSKKSSIYDVREYGIYPHYH
jgi:hypothetical protein